LTQITTISDFGDALIIQGQDMSMMSLILFDEACIYISLIDIDNVQFFLKNFNLARTLLLGLEGIRE